jgi:hypothetical protein
MWWRWFTDHRNPKMPVYGMSWPDYKRFMAELPRYLSWDLLPPKK